jgi:hypothetical protein
MAVITRDSAAADKVAKAGDTMTGALTLPTIIGSTGLVIKPGSDSTTAIQFQKADGTLLVKLDTTNGRLELVKGVSGLRSSGLQLLNLDGSDNMSIGQDATIAAVFIRSAGSTRLYAGGNEQIRINAGSITAHAVTTLGSSTLMFANVFSRLQTITSNSTSVVTQTVKAVVSQTADLTQWTSSADAVLARVEDDGIIQAAGYKSSDGSVGWTGTFTNGDGDTVTVKNGLITAVTA